MSSKKDAPKKNKSDSKKKKEALKKSPNSICNTCLLWRQFQDNCWVYWEGKKYCTQRVETTDEWDAQKALMKK